MCLVDPKKRYRQQEKIRLPFFSSFIYANNEPKSALARELGDCRDNKGNIVFLEVRPSLRRIPASDNALYIGDRDKRVWIF